MPTKRTYADHGDACATAHAMELLGDRWTYPILRELMLAPKRFGELAAGARGVTPAVLTARLRELEKSGLIERETRQGSSRAAAYRITDWGQELRPVFDALGRWAQASPVWETQGCGLTADGIVQSMLTMAPRELPVRTELELRLRDERSEDTLTYAYRLRWDRELTIERGEAPRAQARVTGDSSVWADILYDGRALSDMKVHGERDAVHRVVAAFADSRTRVVAGEA